jgi:ADP-ribosylglycohydrolase
VLGAAIGDALGHPVEFIGSLEAIRKAYGPEGVTGYVLWWRDGAQRFAPYTDDTQMAEVTLRALLASCAACEALEPTMERIGRGYAEWAETPQGGHRAPGQACLRGARELRSGRPWRGGDPEAGGCGSVMRAHSFGVLFSHDESTAER